MSYMAAFFFEGILTAELLSPVLLPLAFVAFVFAMARAAKGDA